MQLELDGSAYWMSENGFFTYDGQLKSMPCLVEDFVYSLDPGRRRQLYQEIYLMQVLITYLEK